MSLFKVEGIEWDTDGAVVEGLPTNTEIFADSEDDLSDILSDEYGWCVSSIEHTEEIPSARVYKQWANNYEKVLIHGEITIQEAKEICSSDESKGDDEHGPWAYYWYTNHVK